MSRSVQREKTEVVQFRLSVQDKIRLQEIAKKQFRTFADQCRLVLREWVDTEKAD